MPKIKYINGLVHHNYRFGLKNNFKVFICRLFGHRINDNKKFEWCNRCGLAYFDIYINQLIKSNDRGKEILKKKH